MIYRSNLECPDFSGSFKHLVSRPMSHSFGHDVLSDWSDKHEDDPMFGIYKKCGLLTHDEATILWNISLRVKGQWLDIGSHTGWSSTHIHARGVLGIDPMYGVEEFLDRAKENIKATNAPVRFLNSTSRAYFARLSEWANVSNSYDGIMIDGDHSDGEPQHDAEQSIRHLASDGVIVFHDFIGRPVQEAVAWLMQRGMKSRVYFTPHMMAVCWWGESFKPPDHVNDSSLGFLADRVTEFSLARCA